MFDLKHVGGRTHPVTGDQYNAFEISSRVGGDRSQWPSMPVFPKGHLIFTPDGRAYEVVTGRTVMHETTYSRQVSYQHSYLCREADPRGLR